MRSASSANATVPSLDAVLAELDKADEEDEAPSLKSLSRCAEGDERLVGGAASTGSAEEAESTEVPSLADLLGAIDAEEAEVLDVDDAESVEDGSLPVVSRECWLAARAVAGLPEEGAFTGRHPSEVTTLALIPSVEECLAKVDRGEIAKDEPSEEEKAERRLCSQAFRDQFGAKLVERPALPSQQIRRAPARQPGTLGLTEEVPARSPPGALAGSSGYENAAASSALPSLGRLGKTSLADKLAAVERKNVAAAKRKPGGVFAGLLR